MSPVCPLTVVVKLVIELVFPAIKPLAVAKSVDKFEIRVDCSVLSYTIPAIVCSVVVLKSYKPPID